MAYARDDIDKVRQSTDLVELVQAVTKVKRSGRSFMAICPFHQEKSPSMSLDPGRGLYHCFGCQKGGDVFTFLQETQGLDFNESVEELARRAGIQLQSDPGADRRRGRRDALLEVVRRAIEVYHKRLKTGEDAGQARGYLRSRGYDGAVVDDYRLGYAPGEWDVLVRELRAGGVNDQSMIDAGLARRGRGGKVYDYFRDRVMFPIHDLRGDPVGFGGRILAGEGAKYLNSPDSAIYNKSRLLYGLDRARSAISRNDRSVVVEGYTDVIALHQAGMPEAVATCGTALTDEHFDLLRRFSERVILAFDADDAGVDAARRTSELEAPTRLDLDMRVAIMPDGGDPADIVQAGRVSEVVSAVEDARPLLQFRLERDFAKLDTAEPEGKARALHLAAGYVGRIKDPVGRGQYEEFIAREIGVERETVAQAMRSGRGLERVEGELRQPSRPRPTVESSLLRVMVLNPMGAEVIVPELFQQPENREAAEVLAGLRPEAGTEVDIGAASVPDHVRDLLRGVLLDDRPLAVPELLARARTLAIDTEIDRLELTVASTDPSDEGYSVAFNRLIALQQEKRRA